MKNLARVAALAALAFTATAAPRLAHSSDIARAGLIPPFEAITAIRSLGFDPAGAPRLRGTVYVVRAIDDDTPVRVTVDARTGRVLTVTELIPGEDYSTPARVGSYPMPPGRIPSVSDYRPPATRPAVIARTTPTPRVRPAEAAAGDGSTPADTTASIPQAKSGTGKSIPAPVARTARASKPTASGAANETAAAKPQQPTQDAAKPEEQAAAKPETPMVPVAPLE